MLMSNDYPPNVPAELVENPGSVNVVTIIAIAIGMLLAIGVPALIGYTS